MNLGPNTNYCAQNCHSNAFAFVCGEPLYVHCRDRLQDRRLTSVQVGIEGDNILPTTITNRQSIRPTFDQVVGSIEYLLDQVEDLRRKYQLSQLVSSEDRRDTRAKFLHTSKSPGTFSSLRSPLALRQRIRDNQKQKSFLVITKWAICDARRFHDKMGKLKSLIDDLEDITKAARLSMPNSETASLAVLDDTPPPYSATELQQQPSAQIERAHQPPIPQAVLTNLTPIDPSLSTLSEYQHTLERFLSVWPDQSGTSRPKIRGRLFALTVVQFQELTQDVHDELLRRQRYDLQTPQWLPHNALFHPKRNEARRMLSTVVYFRQLVSDIVFEFERRLRDFEDPGVSPSSPSFPTPITSPNPQNPRRWGVYNPPPLLRYRAAHPCAYYDPNSLAHTNRGSIPLSTFYNPSMIPSNKIQQRDNSDTWQCCEGRQWPMDRVVSWLVIHDFSNEWQITFKALNICGEVFLELGDSYGGRSAFGTMHQQVYPRLAMECVKSGKDWHQAIQREEGKRLRRLVRKIPFRRGEPNTPGINNSNTTRPGASVQIFRFFPLSLEDPCSKVLPAALEKYNITASWEQYALYIVYGNNERCLGMEEKPLALFKQLDKEGKKPLFMLRKIAPSTALAPCTYSNSVRVRDLPGGLV